MLKRLFSRRSAPALAAAPSGHTVGEQLVYAVGDIHGRLDLLEALLARLCDDMLKSRVTGPARLVFLGDYIDRGPDSFGVIQRIIGLQKEPAFQVCALKGNHEDQMLAFLSDPRKGPPWADFGGAETMASYGLEPLPPRTRLADWDAARLALAEAVPAEHLAFLKALELYATVGDYMFVHAGVRPFIPIAEQTAHDMMWIRDEFLLSTAPCEKVVVHGHTPAVDPYNGTNRIGIDTGAYATGILTAVRLQGETRRMISTGMGD